jgi:hypothetical protein
MKSLKNLITAPVEDLLLTPEDPQVFQDIELVYSEMQKCHSRPYFMATRV